MSNGAEEIVWPCHKLPKEQWCDHSGSGGFMGHTCSKLPDNPATKDTNPKDAIASGKVQFGAVPAQVLWEIGLGMTEGGLKYRTHNYRVAGVRSSIYYTAAMGHLMDWWEGEDMDPDCPALTHVTKAICSLVVLRDAMIQGKLNDDRPPRSRNGWKRRLNAEAEKMIKACKDPKPPYTQKGLE